MCLLSTFGTPLNFPAIKQNEESLYLVLPSSTLVWVISDARPNIFFNLINLFLAALGVHCCTQLCLVAASRGSFLLQRATENYGGFSRGARALGRAGFSSCGTQAWLIAPRHEESFQTRDQSCVWSALAGRFLTTRRVHRPTFLYKRFGGWYFLFPGGSDGKESACNVGYPGSIPALNPGSPGGGLGTPLQCSCLGNPMDRGAWRPQNHRVRHDWAAKTHTHFLLQ